MVSIFRHRYLRYASFTFLHLFCIYVLIHNVKSQIHDFPPDYSCKLCENDDIPFHFIIAGSGSAGSTLAVRLSEESSWNILLLERGTDHITNNTEIPIFWHRNLKTALDYDYKSEPDEKLYKGLDGGVCSIPRGKGSGGSSMINAQIFLRGSRKDFDEWKNCGCEGWDYESVKPYFLKLEDYRSKAYNAFYHHKGGPLTCSPLYAADPAVDIFKKAFDDTKLGYVEDFNAELKVGYGFSDSTTRDGLRCSTFKAYIPLAASRKNFFFARNTLVRKVIIDPQTKTATGVEISLSNGKHCIINALNEVILSLGSIASPQILMLSGIGPKAHLESLGIPVVANLASGENYQDHTGFTGLLITDNLNRPIEEIKKASEKINHDTMDFVNKHLATLGMTNLMAFINTRNDGDTNPDLQIIFMRLPYRSFLKTDNKRNTLYNCFGFSDDTSELFTQWNNKADSIFPMLIVSKGNSRGSVKLRSTNAEDYPKIIPNLLASQEDIDILLRGVRYIQRLLKTKSASDANLELQFINYKACQQYQKDSDDYWKCAFNQVVTGFYHPVGSVKMGAESDPTAVLTPDLKVKCVKNLRVVDASIMPRIVSVNPNPTVIMIAEKIADEIKREYGKLKCVSAP